MKTRREMNLEATRAALLAAGRAQFAADGFAKAELGRIAADAGVTTGAIYHHFGSKAGLFQAVAEQIEAEILQAANAASGTDPLERLRQGFDLLIEVCARPDVQRIIVVEAPQVLGPQAWYEIELRYAFGALRTVLAGLAAQGRIPSYPIDLLARVLLALLREVSGAIARSGHDPAAIAQARGLASSVLDGLFAV
jgi:AcrR family transcriptional regulator